MCEVDALNEKERWESVREGMKTEPMTLGWKMSSTVRFSMIGLLFILARYKFAVKMLQNKKRLTVVDLGCNDGLGALMLRQNCDCEKIIGIDFDREAIAWAEENLADDVLQFIEDDFLGKNLCTGGADCILSLDVIEHIPLEKEQIYLGTICDNLRSGGFAIIGTPNVTMYPYANPWNKKAHINNYDQKRLYELFSRRFRNVFIFGMNDEVLNTAFYPMNCYIIALCCDKT